MLKSIATLSEQIHHADEQIAKLAEEKYPETRLLRQVKGVGPLIALTFVLTLDDPHRFRKSRLVGSYLGLRPRQRESGDSAPQLGISKGVTATCAGCWCRRRSTCWDRSRRIVDCGDGDCNWPRAAERMRRSGRLLPWRASWRSCCTGSGSRRKHTSRCTGSNHRLRKWPD